MTKTFFRAAALACFLLLPLNQALAHGGGTDRHGCHTETRTGERHCHNRKDEDRGIDWAIVGGVAGGALLLWLAVELLDRGGETAAAERLRIAPYPGAAGGMGFAAEYGLGGAGAIGVRAVPPVEAGHERGHVGAYWRLGF